MGATGRFINEYKFKYSFNPRARDGRDMKNSGAGLNLGMFQSTRP
tara:strand:+ start:3354 stop:3488 length:135 start_codon:yes stop_codon:yes gene_type:complete